MITKFGGAAGYGGSALQQALAHSATNLSQQINADLAGAKERYAFNLMNMSSQNKQFNAQNRGNAAQFALSEPSAYIPKTNQSEQAYANLNPVLQQISQKYPKFGEWTGMGGETPPINPTTTNIGGGA